MQVVLSVVEVVERDEPDVVPVDRSSQGIAETLGAEASQQAPGGIETTVGEKLPGAA